MCEGDREAQKDIEVCFIMTLWVFIFGLMPCLKASSKCRVIPSAEQNLTYRSAINAGIISVKLLSCTEGSAGAEIQALRESPTERRQSGFTEAESHSWGFFSFHRLFQT